MLAQEALQQALMDQFHQLKSQNPSFSLRAYARRLQINSGALSAIMNGNRRVSSNAAQRLIERMGLEPEKSERIQALFEVDESRKAKRIEKDVLRLKSDQFKAIADGIHYSILQLLDTYDFSSDPSWIAERLEETPTRVEQAIERLVRLGLIVHNERNELRRAVGEIRTSDGLPDAAIKHFHEERLHEAALKLHRVDIEDRDFYAATLAIKQSQLPAAKQLLREFKRQMTQILDVEPKDEVYRLCIQLYPATRIRKTKGASS